MGCKHESNFFSGKAVEIWNQTVPTESGGEYSTQLLAASFVQNEDRKPSSEEVFRFHSNLDLPFEYHFNSCSFFTGR